MRKLIVSLGLLCFVYTCKNSSPDNGSQEKQIEKEVNARILTPEGKGYSTQDLEQLSHTDLMTLVYEEPKDTISTIGILLYDDYFSLDAMGPHSVLSSMFPAKTFFIAKERGIVKSNNGLKTKVDTTISEVKQLDMLVVPGGTSGTHKATQDRELLDWIRVIDKNSKYTTSVCTGAWILGAAGLLEGKKATTNWYRAEEKLEKYGAIFVDQRFTNDGKYWTSAGVSAGIDMSLALVDHILGRNYAEFVMLNLEYDPTPPFEGGSPKKTDPVITFMTTKMYDLSIDSSSNSLQ